MSIAEKLTTVAANMPKVFAAGQKSEYDRFWNAFQYNGTRGSYLYAFCGAGWTDHTFKPKYNIVPTGANYMFRETGIKDLKQCLTSSGVVLDLSATKTLTGAFGYNAWLQNVPKIDLSAMTSSQYLFQSDSELKTIEEIRVSTATTFTAASSFSGCTALTRLIMVGTLATNGLDLHWSTKLDKESLLSILNVLQDKTSAGGTWSVALGTDNLAKLTDAEKAIATQKGWTLV